MNNIKENKDETIRIEFDSMGEVEVDTNQLWGAQTQRSLQFFNIGQEQMPKAIIDALVMIKKAAALANTEVGCLAKADCLDENIARAIVYACDQILQGGYQDQFPLKVWQTGSGTQSNMNVNEVIANIANRHLGQPLGTKSPVHPNDHVNKSQSSNDCMPTAMHIGAAMALNQSLLPRLKEFKDILEAKSEEFRNVKKIGRTHLQDAVPMYMGEEFSAFATQIKKAKQRIKHSLESVYELAQGGTAVGNGLNCPQGFSERFIAHICHLTNMPFKSAPNKFYELACHDSLVELSGALNTLAVSCMKIANDIRWLASGPRCGLGEISLPENEPGSSIMPGKVNPTQAEALTMICCQVMGNHACVTIAGSQGNFQLNVFKPVIIFNILQSINLLSEGIASFIHNCLLGINIVPHNLERNLEQSLMNVTVLNPIIGYDAACKIAKKAFLENKTIKQIVIEEGIMSAADFEDLL